MRLLVTMVISAIAGRLSCLALVPASLIALSTTAASSAFATTSVACPPQPIRVAFDNRGHNYYQGKGFDLDLALELGRRSGCRLTVSEMPRARIFAGIEQGDVDMAFLPSRPRSANAMPGSPPT